MADTGVITWCDDTSAVILGPKAWNEPSLRPVSEESCMQKITAENHVRTEIEH